MPIIENLGGCLNFFDVMANAAWIVAVLLFVALLFTQEKFLAMRIFSWFQIQFAMLLSRRVDINLQCPQWHFLYFVFILCHIFQYLVFLQIIKGCAQHINPLLYYRSSVCFPLFILASLVFSYISIKLKKCVPQFFLYVIFFASLYLRS